MRYSIIGNRLKISPFVDVGIPDDVYIPDFSIENKIIKETGITSDLEILKRRPELESVLTQVVPMVDNPPRLSGNMSDDERFDSMIPKGMELSEIEDYVSENERLAVEEMNKRKSKSKED